MKELSKERRELRVSLGRTMVAISNFLVKCATPCEVEYISAVKELVTKAHGLYEEEFHEDGCCLCSIGKDRCVGLVCPTFPCGGSSIPMEESKLSKSGDDVLREALAEVEAGQVKMFNNVEDLIEDLKREE